MKLSDLTPDSKNANRGTERGRALLEKSLRQYGAGRSILVDKHGRIIAGNKTAETANDIGIDDVILVKTDGNQLVAVMRQDLDLDDEAARMLAYADNRVGQVSLDFDPEQVTLDSGLPLDEFWFESELDELEEMTESNEVGPEATHGNMGSANSVRAVMVVTKTGIFERAIKQTGIKNRGDALIEICENYLNEKGQFDF